MAAIVVLSECIFYLLLMSIELSKLPIEEMLAAVKNFKRNGDRITNCVR